MWKVFRVSRSRTPAVMLGTMLLSAAGVEGRASAAESSAPEATEASQSSSATAPQEHASARHGSAFVDPLGFALFGPRLGVEAGAGHFSGALHARYFSAGLLARSLFLEEDNDFGFSYGVGLRGRYYFAQGLAGAHLGVAAEYLHSRVENQTLLVATSSNYFVPYAEAGYRFAFGSFYADASAGLGYALKLSASVEDLPGGSSSGLFEVRDESSFYGTASLDLGIYF